MLNSLLLWILIAPPGPVTVAYKDAGPTKLMMDIYSPAEVKPGMPAVVVLHGGAWVAGERTQMAALCQAMADQGMVAATVSYRLAPAHKWPAMVEDAQDAVRYLRDNASKYSIDPRRIGAAGASAGGHLSLLLGMTDGWPDGKSSGKTSSKVAAVFNLFGPFDCAQDFSPLVTSFLTAQLLGKKAEEAAEDIKLFSPAHYVSRDDAPVFTIHGDMDPTVPPKQCERLDVALKGVGVSHTLRLIKGMGHNVDRTKKEQADAIAEAIGWLKATLSK